MCNIILVCVLTHPTQKYNSSTIYSNNAKKQTSELAKNSHYDLVELSALFGDVQVDKLFCWWLTLHPLVHDNYCTNCTLIPRPSEPLFVHVCTVQYVLDISSSNVVM